VSLPDKSSYLQLLHPVGAFRPDGLRDVNRTDQENRFPAIAFLFDELETRLLVFMKSPQKSGFDF